MVSLCLTVRPSSPFFGADGSLARRWKEALLASRNHPQGKKIVPKVNLAGTSMTAVGEGRGKVTLEELKRFQE